MKKPRKWFPMNPLIGCIGVPLLGILALCGGPRVYGYFYERSIISEFRTNRAYYEGLVRQIQADNIPVNEMAFYFLPKNRYEGGPMLKMGDPGNPESSYHNTHYGTRVMATNGNGVLRINFGMRVNYLPFGIPSLYGVMYCAGDNPLPGTEESLEKFEDRWWLFSWFLGH